jgi:hypothetical protein
MLETRIFRWWSWEIFANAVNLCKLAGRSKISFPGTGLRKLEPLQPHTSKVHSFSPITKGGPSTAERCQGNKGGVAISDVLLDCTLCMVPDYGVR